MIYVELALIFLALGEVFDRAFSDELKQKLAASIMSSGDPAGPELALAGWADRWMGPRLLSWRALRLSFILTAITLSLALFLATFPNSLAVRSVLQAVFSNGSAGAIAFLICLVGVVLADYLSIAQTRLFARAIGKFRDQGVAYLLCAADLFMSLGIFCTVFSLFRLLTYLWVAATIADGQMFRQTWVSPAVIAGISARSPEALALLHRKPLPDDASDLSVWRTLVRAGEAPTFNSAALTSRLKADELPGADAVAVYNSGVQCYPGANGTAQTYLGQAVFVDTYNTIHRGLAPVEASENFKGSLQYVLRAELDRLNGAPEGECSTRIIGIERHYHLGELFAQAGWWNVYLATLDITTQDIFRSLSTKLSNYLAPDLYKDVRVVIANGWTSKSTSFLGLTGVDGRAEAVAGQIATAMMMDEKEVIIPFSTFALSAIGPSLLLFGAVLWRSFARLLIWIRSRVVRSTSPDISRNVGRSFAGAIVVLSGTILIGIWVLGLLWRLLSSAL